MPFRRYIVKEVSDPCLRFKGCGPMLLRLPKGPCRVPEQKEAIQQQIYLESLRQGLSASVRNITVKEWKLFTRFAYLRSWLREYSFLWQMCTSFRFAHLSVTKCKIHGTQSYTKVFWSNSTNRSFHLRLLRFAALETWECYELRKINQPAHPNLNFLASR